MFFFLLTNSLWDVRPTRKEENMTLGKTIKMARTYKDLSAQEVAIQTGIAVSTINNIEKGITKNPELTTLKKIADVLGLDLMDLLNLIGKES